MSGQFQANQFAVSQFQVGPVGGGPAFGGGTDDKKRSGYDPVLAAHFDRDAQRRLAETARQEAAATASATEALKLADDAKNRADQELTDAARAKIYELFGPEPIPEIRQATDEEELVLLLLLAQ